MLLSYNGFKGHIVWSKCRSGYDSIIKIKQLLLHLGVTVYYIQYIIKCELKWHIHQRSLTIKKQTDSETCGFSGCIKASIWNVEAWGCAVIAWRWLCLSFWTGWCNQPWVFSHPWIVYIQLPFNQSPETFLGVSEWTLSAWVLNVILSMTTPSWFVI